MCIEFNPNELFLLGMVILTILFGFFFIQGGDNTGLSILSWIGWGFVLVAWAFVMARSTEGIGRAPKFGATTNCECCEQSVPCMPKELCKPCQPRKCCPQSPCCQPSEKSSTPEQPTLYRF